MKLNLLSYINNIFLSISVFLSIHVSYLSNYQSRSLFEVWFTILHNTFFLTLNYLIVSLYIYVFLSPLSIYLSRCSNEATSWSSIRSPALSIYMSISISVFLSIYPFYLGVQLKRPSCWSSICSPTLSIYMSIYICLSIYLGVQLKRPVEVQSALLRRYFLELTQTFLIPLERYLGIYSVSAYTFYTCIFLAYI